MATQGSALIRQARVPDALEIKKLIDHFVEQDLMLSRSLADIYSRIREFWVVDDPTDGVIGCAALRVLWGDMAEVRSLAVSEKHHSYGYGRDLVKMAIKEARALGVVKILALTYVPDFFKKFGFTEVSKDTLPHKVWSDCVNCPKFPNCDEVALILDLSGDC